MKISDTTKTLKFISKNPKFIAKNVLSKNDISETVKNMAKELGASEVGIITKKTLEGGPVSTDLEYVLSGAKSALVFAVPLDQKLIEPYLSKKDHALNKNKIRTTTFARGIASEIAEFLDMIGFESKAISPNFVYRKDTPNGIRDMKPIISHRYLAARSGVGFFGHSGHILTKEYGAAIVLASVVTTADLKATDPLPESENYCDECKLCTATCIPQFIPKNEKTVIEMGGKEFEYGKRGDYSRCGIVCSGFAGLHPSKKWSTWSPTRIDLPEKDEDFKFAMLNAIPAYLQRPKNGDYFYHPLIPQYKLEYTCSNCQFICHPDKEVRNYRFKILKNSGVIIEDEEGNRNPVRPEEAERIIQDMPDKKKKLYIS